MLSININKLRGEVEAREQRKTKIFEKILDLCYQKILNSNQKSDDYSCTYIVPNVVFGLPLYNVHECVKYITEKLTDKGFEIYFALPTTLHISWLPIDHHSRNTQLTIGYDNQYGNQTDNMHYKSIESPKKHKEKYNDKNRDNQNYSNQGNHGNHGTNQNIIKKKEYRSIDDYTHTKPLIYDPDDINMFQKKLDNIFD